MRLTYLFTLLSLLLLVFAGLQYNDPDPQLWIPLYLLPATVSAYAASRPLPRWLPLLLMGAYLVLAAKWWPARFDGFTGSMSPDTTVEQSREAGGLLICALAFGLAAWLGPRRRLVAPASAVGPRVGQ
jgi:hypothetical protein